MAFAIDVLLFALLLLMLSPRLTGLGVHEWLGLALGIPVLVHLLLSWRWIARSSSRMVAGADLRLRINYLLNAVLFFLLVQEIVSGIAISQVALPAFGAAAVDDRSWRAVHNLYLNELVLVLGLHFAMNWVPLRTGLQSWLPFLRKAHD